LVAIKHIEQTFAVNKRLLLELKKVRSTFVAIFELLFCLFITYKQWPFGLVITKLLIHYITFESCSDEVIRITAS